MTKKEVRGLARACKKLANGKWSAEQYKQKDIDVISKIVNWLDRWLCKKDGHQYVADTYITPDKGVGAECERCGDKYFGPII